MLKKKKKKVMFKFQKSLKKQQLMKKNMRKFGLSYYTTMIFLQLQKI